MFPNLKFFSVVILILCCCLNSIRPCVAQQAQSTSQPHGLGRVFWNLPNADWEQVREKAEETASSSRPYYKSNRENSQPIIFEGYFRPSSNTTRLAVHSDDGVTIQVDDTAVLSEMDKGQALPNIDQSLHEIKPAGSTVWQSDRDYHIKIFYKNIKLTGPNDIDGVTLMAFNGGGVVSNKWKWRADHDGWRWSKGNKQTVEKGKYFVSINVEIKFSYDPTAKSYTAMARISDQSNPHITLVSLSETLPLSSLAKTDSDKGYQGFWSYFAEELVKDFESGKARNRVGYVFKGAGLALVDTVKGTGQMLANPGETITGITTAVRNPRLVAKAINLAGQKYVDTIAKDPDKFAETTGKIAGSIILSIAGTKGANKVATLLVQARRGKTVWDTIKVVTALRPGSFVPQTFTMKVGLRKFYVNTNGTKHMFDHLRRAGTSPYKAQRMINTQALLTSFQAAVRVATKRGIKYDKVIRVDDWELIFVRPRAGEALPVIKHAVYFG